MILKATTIGTKHFPDGTAVDVKFHAYDHIGRKVYILYSDRLRNIAGGANRLALMRVFYSHQLKFETCPST